MFLLTLLTAVTLADSTPSQKTLARLLAEHERRTQSEAGNLLGGGALRLPDLSAAKVQRDATRARAVVNELDLLKPAELSADEWLTSRILRFDLLTPIENARYDAISFAFITPYQSPLSSLASNFARLPLTTEADTRRFLGMVDSLPMLADTVRAKLESRRANKVLLPKDEIRLIVPFLRAFAPPAAQSPFLPGAARLEALPPATRTAFTTALTTRIDGPVRAAFDRLASWLDGPYLAEAPTTVGLSQYPDGAAFYRTLVRRATTMDVTAEQVHAIGLAEVARIDSAMTAIRAELGFQGTKAEFHAQLAKDPKFFAKVPEEFGEKLMYHDARIRPRIGEMFATVPRAQGNVQRLDPRLEASMTFGYYQVPTPQDSMGHYLYNGSNLPERSMLGAASLVFHELIPGHHFQIATQRESTTLPAFRRQSTHTVFTEGWGEYAAALAGEMGLYSDPYDRYGRLAMDIFLSCRLVVDTGMNALGWSRERAIAYLKEYTLQSDLQIDTETLRYSVDLPGQALAYKMGSRELLRLREDARKRLGTRFDIKRWHAFILEGGSMPLNLLRQRKDAWIAAGAP
jgi:uncharacterized protein (DUF885 family)